MNAVEAPVLPIQGMVEEFLNSSFDHAILPPQCSPFAAARAVAVLSTAEKPFHILGIHFHRVVLAKGVFAGGKEIIVTIKTEKYVAPTKKVFDGHAHAGCSVGSILRGEGYLVQIVLNHGAENNRKVVELLRQKWTEVKEVGHNGNVVNVPEALDWNV